MRSRSTEVHLHRVDELMNTRGASTTMLSAPSLLQRLDSGCLATSSGFSVMSVACTQGEATSCRSAHVIACIGFYSLVGTLSGLFLPNKITVIDSCIGPNTTT